LQAFENIKRSQLEKYHSLPAEKKEDFEMQDPNELLRVAINNIKPIMVLTPIKRGGVRYQVTFATPSSQL
jgi:small subunit ribosomal protein S7